MTIEKYTFYSPNGDDFPVTANADGKLYMMLTGMEYGDLRVKHWKKPLDTALNRVYTNTSIIIAGRYFELKNHAVTLLPTTTNFIHAIIDLSNSIEPVSITVEDTNTSNEIDINNESGILKICFDIVTTDSSSVVNSNVSEQVTKLGVLKIDSLESSKTKLGADLSITSVTQSGVNIGNGVVLIFERKGEMVIVRFSGTLTTIGAGNLFPNPIPKEWRPTGTKELIGHFAGGDTSFHVDLGSDGSVRWWGRANANGTPRGTATYFL
ncbi:hypothetical protein OGZ46_02460 [Lactococcus lactis]|uniref:hypothetical protein n=1 Tax=Lactococcus lactis TaxID=1358 RepID=UPI002415B01A|nr:hypothetical protein [Lactococcus lactis]MDG4985765.1 hypothetical protein [Lactococcus lactis]